MKRTHSTVVGPLAAWCLLVLCETSPLHAEHANINLQVIGPDGRAESSVDQEPPEGGREKVPVLEAETKQTLVFQFFLTNVYPHAIREKVTVRYYVVPIESLRQKRTPDPEQGNVRYGKVQMDFKPKCRVGARFRFSIDQPGRYRVRVDTLGTKSDHEHFSAIDLDVR